MVLLYNYSTMDLFYILDLVEYVQKLKEPLRIQINDIYISANQKSNIPGYNKKVWFIRRTINNIIAFKNLTEEYRVTYDNNDLMFVVHREEAGIPSMEFLMHDSIMHYYERRRKNI